MDKNKENKEIWIFLSHSSEDFEKVRLIRNYLEEKKFRPLMFYLRCLNSEEEIYDLIKREIDARTRFILCDSANARASVWVKKEMDYISNKEEYRSYEVLDLSEPMETLQAQLDSYSNKTNVYISYAHSDIQLCDNIFQRLQKYDLRVLCDYDFLANGVSFEDEIKKNIQHAANNGFFVALCTTDYINSEFNVKELKYAKEMGANIIPIALSEYAYNYLQYKQDVVNPNSIVNLSAIPPTNNSDDVTDAILRIVLTIGARKTHADNFRIGKFLDKDEEESDKLYRKLLEEAENSMNPHALKFIGRCYEYGLGVNKDLTKALGYYSEYIHDPEINADNDKDFLNHVRELNEQVNKEYRSKKSESSKKLYFGALFREIYDYYKWLFGIKNKKSKTN